MRNNTALKALYTADILKMRGRGSGCYDYQDYTECDAGCFDWEVECVADAQQGYEYDFDHYLDRLNIGEEEYVEEHIQSANPSKTDLSRDIQVGQEVLNDIKNGNVPIVLYENSDNNSDENSEKKIGRKGVETHLRRLYCDRSVRRVCPTVGGTH